MAAEQSGARGEPNPLGTHFDRWKQDPRPDLTSDTALWSRLLALAFNHDGGDPGGLFGALHGLRCYGASLILARGSVRLAAGEMSAEEYQQLRQEWLVPHGRVLRDLLRALADETAEVA